MYDLQIGRCPLCRSAATTKPDVRNRATSIVCPVCTRVWLTKRAQDVLTSLPGQCADALRAAYSREAKACSDNEVLEVYTEPDANGPSVLRTRVAALAVR